MQVQKVDAEGNPIPENDEAKDAEQDAEDAKEEAQPIQFTRLGSAECPVDPSDESIDYAMSYRIPKIENLEQCTQLTVSPSQFAASIYHVVFCSLVPGSTQELDQKDRGARQLHTLGRARAL